MTQITRANYILIKALQSNINFTEARVKVNEENGDLFDLSKQNGDTININKIYNSDEQVLTDFFKNIPIFTNKKRGKTGELIYYAYMNTEKSNNFYKIKKLTTINNKLFNNPNSIYKILLNKIKNDYIKIDTTSNYDRSIVSGKSNTAANYSIEYKGNIYVLTYSLLSFSDIFDEKFNIKPKKEISENIIKKLKTIECLELFEKYDNNFTTNFIEIVNSILENL